MKLFHLCLMLFVESFDQQNKAKQVEKKYSLFKNEEKNNEK